MFVVATKELDTEALTDQRLLEVYKDQGVTVERGFRFLKDSMFYAENLCLRSPKRIISLTMVMTLSLLTYALAERRVRTALRTLGGEMMLQYESDRSNGGVPQ